MRTIAVTGATGLLGNALVRTLRSMPVEVIEYTRSLDVRSEVGAQLTTDIDVCIHCAANASVANCEADPDEAWRVNVLGTRSISQACRRNSIKLVHISTDFVFEGRPDTWYDESSPPQPLQVYGRTKAASEQEARCALNYLIVRLPLLFGTGRRATWPISVAQALLAGGKFWADDNETRQPAFTDEVAKQIVSLVDIGVTGLIHLAPEATTTKLRWARLIARLLNVDEQFVAPRITPAGGPARPLHASLASNRMRSLNVTPLRSYDLTTTVLLRSSGLL